MFAAAITLTVNGIQPASGRRSAARRMIFDVDSWTVTERGLHLDALGQVESVFALSNGHIGLRGNLDEGEPCGTRGTYANGCFEAVAHDYAEPTYGWPEADQRLVDVTDGKLIRLLVDDEPFDVRDGTVLGHERVLDLRAGVLRREVRWRSPAGRTVRVRTTRLVSLTQRTVTASAMRSSRSTGPPGSSCSPSSREWTRRCAASLHRADGLRGAARPPHAPQRPVSRCGHEPRRPRQAGVRSDAETDLARVTFSVHSTPVSA